VGVEADEERLKRVGRLKPEVKVNMAIDVTEAMVHICAEDV
jgi:hypothetical protein